MSTAEPLPNWQPRGVDFSTPSTARMYDYYLGGKDNFAVDREAAEKALAASPDGPQSARNNRTFLANAVRVMTEAGISQFIDIGTGIPTSPSVHEVARETHPAARVVYVDNDPVVLAHDRALLATDDNLTILEADMADPHAITNDPGTSQLIDLERPVGLLMVAVLHFAPGDEARRITATWRDAVPSGSMLAVSCSSREGADEDMTARVEASYSRATSGITLRGRTEIGELLTGFELLQPGLCDVATWRAQGPRTTITVLGGVGRKP